MVKPVKNIGDQGKAALGYPFGEEMNMYKSKRKGPRAILEKINTRPDLSFPFHFGSRSIRQQKTS